MVDEVSTRRSRLLPGTPICLANDQEWTFPAPTADPVFATEPTGNEYVGLIQAVREAEDQSEQRLAELALAIFLIGLNYQLGASNLVSLFTFPPESQKLADSQCAFESLARDHLLFMARHERQATPIRVKSTSNQPISRRLLAWMRSHGLIRKGFPRSRKSEAVS
jgi:hypothetical protein